MNVIGVPLAVIPACKDGCFIVIFKRFASRSEIKVIADPVSKSAIKFLWLSFAGIYIYW